jgi:RNA polymerase sigma-70 factor, ECF subfamily
MKAFRHMDDQRPKAEPGDITRLLADVNQGSKSALDLLTPVVYSELRRLAASHLRRERAGMTLQPTALVHEAYLRLVNQQQPRWEDRAQFFGIAARLMRQILVDHARRRNSKKRAGDQVRVTLDENVLPSVGGHLDILALDRALEELAQIRPRQAQIIEMRYFAGLTAEESASVLGISDRTVKSDLYLAQAWLFRKLRGAAQATAQFSQK